jgi:nucleotide-binding universal stress UspA family protein
MTSRIAPQSSTVEIEIKPHENITRAILNEAQSYDLVVMRSLWRRIGADGLAMGEVTTPLVQQLTCSVVLLGEPSGTPSSVLAKS